MKKILKIILILSLFFITAGKIQAADLKVICDVDSCAKSNEDPLFDESNILPGFEVTKTVEATNYGETRDFAVEAKNFNDPNNLGNVLFIEIKETGGSVLYSDNLTNFSGLYHVLSTINAGDSQEYEFKVNFPTWVGNEYQDRELVFDLELGFDMFKTEPTPTPTPTPNGNDCTAEYPGPVLGLTATPGVNTVTLNWNAITPVTHYAIRYGISPGVYLYGNYNIGNTTSYVVSGLSAGYTYYFQVVGFNDCAGGDWSAEVSATPTGVVIPAGEGEETPPPAEEFKPEVQGETTEGEINGGISSTGNVEGEHTGKICFWWIVLSVLALFVNSMYIRKYREDFKTQKIRFLVLMLVSFLSYVLDTFAHNWWHPSRFCPWMAVFSSLTFLIPVIGWYYWKNK